MIFPSAQVLELSEAMMKATMTSFESSALARSGNLAAAAAAVESARTKRAEREASRSLTEAAQRLAGWPAHCCSSRDAVTLELPPAHHMSSAFRRRRATSSEMTSQRASEREVAFSLAASAARRVAVHHAINYSTPREVQVALCGSEKTRDGTFSALCVCFPPQARPGQRSVS